MAADPFKIRVSKARDKEPLVLTEAYLERLIKNSQANEKVEEDARLEERRKRQEATKALSRKVVQRKEPGSELRKRQYAQDLKSAYEEQEREARIEARRNYVLDLAYKRLFEETDRVKNFKAARNFAEMLKQRDMQLEAKAKMAGLFSSFDKSMLLGMLRDIDSYKTEEVAKIEKVKADRKKNANNWNKQREEVQKKRKQEEWEHIRDGYIIREAFGDYTQELKAAEQKQKQKMKEYKIMLDQQRDQKSALMEMYAQLDEADDKRAKLFNEAKRDMKIKHKEIKDELDKKKNQKRQYVAMNLRDESSALKVKEEAILQKAIREADAKHKEECAIKKAEQDAALKAIQEFYEHEMDEKAKRQFDERVQSYQERRKITDKVEQQLLAEEANVQGKKDLGKEAQHLQLHQIAKRKMDKQAEKLEDMKDYLSHMRSLENEEETFQKYAQLQIAECEARGIDTRPMRVAAKPGIECGRGPLYKDRGYIRPRYYSAVAQGDELSHVKRDQKRPDSKSRLGFMLH